MFYVIIYIVQTYYNALPC